MKNNSKLINSFSILMFNPTKPNPPPFVFGSLTRLAGSWVGQDLFSLILEVFRWSLFWRSFVFLGLTSDPDLFQLAEITEEGVNFKSPYDDSM